MLERDYCLAWFPIGLSRSSLREHLVFEGGTALKRCYFGEHRFSEDLDFTLAGEMPLESILAGLEEVYRQIAIDERRNRLILNDVIQALVEKRSPILLTERRDRLDYLAHQLRGPARNLIILHGGMKAKDRRAAIEQLVSIPKTEERSCNTRVVCIASTTARPRFASWTTSTAILPCSRGCSRSE